MSEGGGWRGEEGEGGAQFQESVEVKDVLINS